jgi:hypothetical protein
MRINAGYVIQLSIAATIERKYSPRLKYNKKIPACILGVYNPTSDRVYPTIVLQKDPHRNEGLSWHKPRR